MGHHAMSADRRRDLGPPGRPAAGHAARAGFTLVEMLVVIAIIAMLTALVTPAVMNARRRAQIASIKLEIDMLHKAIVNYKNEYGTFPPCNSGTAAGQPMVKHLQRLFPRCPDVPAHLAAVGAGAITPSNALASWLLGFTNDPSRPLGTAERLKLFDFDAGRFRGGAYAPAGLPGSPYVYLDSSSYATLAYTGETADELAVMGAHRVPATPPGDKPDSTVPNAWYFTTAGSGTNVFFNPDSFQILCAGLDGVFGTDDDMSNFWRGTRGDYLDSPEP